MQILRYVLLVLFAVGVATEGTPSASKLRRNAEDAMVGGKYKLAAKLLGDAIKLEPDNADNYYKRFRIHLRQKKYRNAISDLKKAVAKKPSFGSAWVQLGKLNKKLGHCATAVENFNTAAQLSEKDAKKAKAELPAAQECMQLITSAKAAVAQGSNLQKSVEALSKASELAPLSSELHLLRAEGNFKLGNFYEVLADAGKALKINKNDINALLTRANAYYKLTEHEMCMRHLREGLKLDPEHKGCKTLYRTLKKLLRFSNKAQEAMDAKDYEQAINMATKAVEADPQHTAHVKTLFLKMCEANFKLKNHEAAKEHCNAAIARDSQYVDAHCQLGETLIANEEYHKAVHAYQKAMEIDKKNSKVREGMQRAQAALKQSKQKNYYKILGVPRDANKRQIKKAYRDLALKYHPDKQKNDEEREVATKAFQEVGEAYEILEDEDLRAKYDRGEDMQEIQREQAGNPQKQHHGFPFSHFQQGGRRFHFSSR